jgi:hypothetical protein
MSQLKGSFSKNPNLMLSGSSNPNRLVINTTASKNIKVKRTTRRSGYFLRKSKPEKRVRIPPIYLLENHLEALV